MTSGIQFIKLFSKNLEILATFCDVIISSQNSIKRLKFGVNDVTTRKEGMWGHQDFVMLKT